MALARTAVEALAPDQSALTAAAGLLKAAKWPVRGRAGDIDWGECQGSGANPYRVAADMAGGGAKCTCPSRKFPCRHGLALMLMCARNEADFTPAATPDWASTSSDIALGAAYVTATITVWDADPRSAAERQRLAETTSQGRAFTCRRETVNAIRS